MAGGRNSETGRVQREFFRRDIRDHMLEGGDVVEKVKAGMGLVAAIVRCCDVTVC